MLFLWIFGNNVEDALGRVRFLLWYLVGGLAATALQTFVTLHWRRRGERRASRTSARAVRSRRVLGAYFVLCRPRACVTDLFVFFVFFVEIPAVVFLGIWFLLQLWEGGSRLTHPEAGGGVAFFAHVGGFVVRVR